MEQLLQPYVEALALRAAQTNLSSSASSMDPSAPALVSMAWRWLSGKLRSHGSQWRVMASSIPMAACDAKEA